MISFFTLLIERIYFDSVLVVVFHPLFPSDPKGQMSEHPSNIQKKRKEGTWKQSNNLVKVLQN